MKRKCSTVLCLLSMLAFMCLQGTTANASSVFDETYVTTNTLYAGDANCEFQANITNTWSSFITEEELWGDEVVSMTEDAKEAFIEAMEDGDVSVSQVSWQQTTTRVGKYVTVYFSEDETSNLVWSEWNDAVSVAGYQYGLLIGCNSGIDATYPTVYLFSTPANSTTGTLSQDNGSSSPVMKNFFTTATQNRPPGYDGASIATQPVLPKYVAMGDSFSSGEGNPSFESGTGLDGTNECHRSSAAYPRLLKLDPNLDLGPMDFVACSGATTNDILGITEDNDPAGKWDESPQINALSNDTEIVTITIGGNDVKFAEFATACVSFVNTLLGDGACDEFTPIYDEVFGLITDSLPGRLENLYTELLEKAPNAQIYIGGYPTISPNKAITNPYDQDCAGLQDEFPNSWGDARAAFEIVNLLNITIEDTVNSVNLQESSTRLHFVDVSNGAFSGHDICESGSDNYFNGIYAADPEYSIHPNIDGQIAYKVDFKDVMS